MFEIFVPDEHDSMSSITLGETEFYLRFTYNSRFDLWSIGIYDSMKEPIIPMTKIVPYFDLFSVYSGTDLPSGSLFCDCKKDTVGESDFRDKTAHMVYAEAGEL